MSKGTIKGFAYPFGSHDNRTKAILRKCGIRYGRITQCEQGFCIPEDFYCWKPTVYHKDKELETLTKSFIDQSLEGSLFHLWGHTCELYEEGLWGRIEDWKKFISQNKDKIWFATNIEICAYLTNRKGQT